MPHGHLWKHLKEQQLYAIRFLEIVSGESDDWKYFTSDKVYFDSWIATRVINIASSDLFDSHNETESIELKLRLLVMMKDEELWMRDMMTGEVDGGTDKNIEFNLSSLS